MAWAEVLAGGGTAVAGIIVAGLFDLRRERSARAAHAELMATELTHTSIENIRVSVQGTTQRFLTSADNWIAVSEEMFAQINNFDEAQKRLNFLEETNSAGDEYDSGPPESHRLQSYLEQDMLGYDLTLKYQIKMREAIEKLKSATVECEVMAPSTAVHAKKFLRTTEAVENQVFSTDWYERLHDRDSIFQIPPLKLLREQAVAETQRSLGMN